MTDRFMVMIKHGQLNFNKYQVGTERKNKTRARRPCPGET